MFLFQICVIALCGIRHCQTLITLEFIRNLQRTESQFMSLVFSDTTCYTHPPESPWKRCVSVPSVLVDYKAYDVTPPFTVTDELVFNILFAGNSLATVSQDTESFMAFIRQTYSGHAVNHSLYDVTEHCVTKASYVEAFIRFMNVVESEGISVLGRICRISSLIIEKGNQKAVDGHLVRIDPIIELIKKKFKGYLISTESVRQIEVAIEVLRTKTKTIEERKGRINSATLEARKGFFNDVCMEFSQRYVNMMDLVSTGTYANINKISSIYQAKTEFENILGRAFLYFTNVTVAWSSDGNCHELIVLDQLQSEKNVIGSIGLG